VIRRAVVLAAGLAGCATRGATTAAPATVVLLDQAELRAVVRLAVEADGTGQADTLYASGATALANGAPRTLAPRLAGVERGATVSVVALQVSGALPFAWALLTYRSAGPRGPGPLGHATLVLQRGERGWRVSHAHSSTEGGR
jgi:hypothetical protein